MSIILYDYQETQVKEALVNNKNINLSDVGVGKPLWDWVSLRNSLNPTGLTNF